MGPPVAKSVGDYIVVNTCHLPLSMIGNPKLKPIWMESYHVSKVVNMNTYQLDLPSYFKQVH